MEYEVGKALETIDQQLSVIFLRLEVIADKLKIKDWVEEEQKYLEQKKKEEVE